MYIIYVYAWKIIDRLDDEFCTSTLPSKNYINMFANCSYQNNYLRHSLLNM